MNLFERATKLKSDVEEIKVLKINATQAESIRSRTSQFENALAKLRLNLGCARLLQDYGLGLEFMVQIDGVLYYLNEIKDKVTENPTTILEFTDVKLKILNPIENETSKIEEKVHRAWRDHVQQQLPRLNEEILTTLSRVPGLFSKVDDIRSLRSEALNYSTLLPKNNSDIDRTHKAIHQCRKKWEDLNTDDLPQEVLDLFRDAATLKGADLSILTPTVFSWLTAHGITDALGIRIR